MKRAPSILKSWQEAGEQARQPTCYEARHPARPRCPAQEPGYEDAEADDRQFVRAWIDQRAEPSHFPEI